MILKPKLNSPMKMHMVDIAINYPKVETGGDTLALILGNDAKLLASRIVSTLKARRSVSELVISSNYATAKFVGITVESEWGAVISSSKPGTKMNHSYSTVITDLNTGKDVSQSKQEIAETTYNASTTLCVSTYGVSLYRAAYILELSKGMEQKNPGAYSVLLKNYTDIGDLPYVTAKLPEKFFGTLEEAGFIFSDLLPFPSSGLVTKLELIPSIMLPYFNTFDTRSTILSLFLNQSSINVDAAVKQLEVLNAAFFGGGDPNLFLLSGDEESFSMDEELMSHLSGRRQELNWIFSQFSRFFEYNGAIEASKINSNLRFFQEQIKNLIDTPYSSALYFEDSPRDLQDFISSWLGHKSYSKDLYYLLLSLDPGKSNYNLEYVSGSSEVLAAIKPYYRHISPGLILMNNNLMSMVDVLESNKLVDKSSLILNLTNRRGSSVVAKLTTDSSHDADIQGSRSLISLITSNKAIEARGELESIMALTLWLCNGDSSKSFLVNKADNRFTIRWPAHVIRRYVKSSIFEGTIKMWMAK